MLTLHQAINETKAILKWGSIVLVILIIFVFIFRAIFIDKIFSPPPPPSATFGKLPKVEFPESNIKNTFVYTINTLSGKLDSDTKQNRPFPDRANVYKIETPEPNVLALNRTQERIANIDFDSPGVALSNTRYQWTDNVAPFRTLIADIYTFNFTLTSRFYSDQNVLDAIRLPDETDAIEFAKSFLENIDAYPPDLESTKTTPLAIEDQELIPTTSRSGAQIIRVDFYQKNINSLPIRYPNYPFSIISVYVASGAFDPQVVKADFVHQTIDETNKWATTEDLEKGIAPATYGLKAAEEAFTELKSEKGYIAVYYGEKNNIAIENVYLAYYIGKTRQDYLMPIYVFEGSDGFAAFVSAVKGESIGK